MFPQKKGAFSTHNEVNKERHARKRRVLSHAFSDKALKAMEEHILDHIEAFCAQLGSTTEPQNMAQLCDYLTFDVLGDLCFGKSFEMQHKPDNRFVKELISKSAVRVLMV